MEKPLALGIIGHPIGHTLSPLMHAVAARSAGVSLAYSVYDVKPENLRAAMEGVRALSIDGLNVTVPHKVDVMESLDEITEEAALIGAVNTIVRKGGRLTGYNTDAHGFLTSLKENAGTDPSGKSVLVYGAGGAARAIVVGLARAGAGRIVIVNRAEGKAERLAEKVKGLGLGAEAEGLGFSSNKLFESVRSADIIVNTTAVGMEGVGGRLPAMGGVRKGQLVVDIVYRPLKTPLLSQAGKAGADALDGLWMLIHQGAMSFTLWTGKPFPAERARRALLAELREESS
ncbi:MAG: shikimate dehydrogenase [Candidatus Nitrospinota bacterium M3_3B_026]